MSARIGVVNSVLRSAEKKACLLQPIKSDIRPRASLASLALQRRKIRKGSPIRPGDIGSGSLTFKLKNATDELTLRRKRR